VREGAQHDDLDDRGSVVNATWLLTTMWIVPPVA
jgi:hypothetical protein